MTDLDDRALALLRAGRHEEAARLWEEAAGQLPPEPAADALVKAADAWRRDDRPAASARCLLAPPVARSPSLPAGQRELLLAAALADAGQHDPARSFAEQALARAADEPSRALALDLCCGLWTLSCAWPQVEEALHGLRPPLAAAFREAVLARARGQLERAGGALEAAHRLLPAEERARPLLAALRAEQAELELARGEARAAVESFAIARALWAGLGRRAPAFAALAGEHRARTLAGERVLPAEALRALSFAEERGLHPLAVELHLALGLAERERGLSPRGLDQAVALARAIGAPLLRRRTLEARASDADRKEVAGLGVGTEASAVTPLAHPSTEIP